MKLKYNRKTGHIQSTTLPYEWHEHVFVFEAYGSPAHIAAFCATGTCQEDPSVPVLGENVSALFGWDVDAGACIKIPAHD